MDCVAATPDPCHDATLSQNALNGEDDLSEEGKVRQKGERRRAKRKRRRKRKKQEQIKQNDSAEQDEEEDGGAESELDESESEADIAEEEKQRATKEENKETKSAAPNKHNATPVMAPAGLKQKTKANSTEEEPEWDVSSAFFANAASHIKPKGSSRKSKENKENEARKETKITDNMTKKSASLTEKGIKLVQEGQYAQAACMFTEAIKCDPKDYRFFGNRSYCYYCLEQYPQALGDAERSIELAPEWAKGYFRKGRALIGMKRYSEAEKAMEQVLKLDKHCEEAVNDLFSCKVLQLMEFGFEEMQSVLLLERFSSVQAVLASCSDTPRAGSHDASVVQPGYGDIESIRVLHERFCAFVNFRNADMAARAMEKLNVGGILTAALRGSFPFHLGLFSLSHSKQGQELVLGDVAQLMETSVTFGELPGAISGINVAINTFLTRKARTGNPGSLELGSSSASAMIGGNGVAPKSTF
ncbi:hypothetical protein CCH79_00001646, partial [Gambusia affinis]